MNKKKIFSVILIVLGIGCIGIGTYMNFFDSKINSKPTLYKKNPENDSNVDFDFNFIKQVNKYASGKNYLISPLSMAYGLSLLKECTNGTSYEQINNALGEYDLSNDYNVKNRISNANALFIKNMYKEKLISNTISNIKSKYNADVIYDEFKNPSVINSWVSEKTYKMIPNLLDEVSPNFVIGMANAFAIDVDWNSEFKCNLTSKSEFTKKDGSKTNVVMMNEYESTSISYLKNDNAEGIIKKYTTYDKTTGEPTLSGSNNSIELEYIAIMPTVNDIDNYINNFSSEELNNLLDTKKNYANKYDINLSLPRYKNGFKIDDQDLFDVLVQMGISDVFKNPDFSKLANKDSGLDLSISKAIHQTEIDLNEKGTKAAAVTYFEVKDNAAAQPNNIIKINFDRPFIYIIKEKNSNNIIFFGTVYEPTVWTDSTVTCSRTN